AGVLKRYSLHTLDDLLAGIGYGGMSTGRVVPRLRDAYIKSLPEAEQRELGYHITKAGHVAKTSRDVLRSEELLTEDTATVTAPPKKHKRKDEIPVKVKGLDNALIRMSRCCSPVPGDEIIGYVTRGTGVAVHRIDCPNIRNILDAFDRSPEDAERASRLIDVVWTNQEGSHRSYPVDLRVIARDRSNLLAEISAAIADEHVSVHSARISSARDISANLFMTVEIENQEQYDRLVGRIKAIDSVVSVSRGHN
ncbi:MAG: ACT domain-containing protein, partial [Saccharofermentanales bacterium]